MTLAARGSRKLNGDAERIEDETLARLLRRRAIKVYVESIAFGIVITLASFLI